MADKIRDLATLDIHTSILINDPDMEEAVFRALYECQKIIENINPRVGCSINWQPDKITR